MIRIITDSASDITLAQAAALGVEIVPLGIHFGGVAYDQLADESFAQFYELLAAAKELPTTSQPSPSAYLPHFTAAQQAGDDVIVVALSGELSGTVQSAKIAAEMSGYERVFVIDSQQAIMGQRLLVEMAVDMCGRGAVAEDIVAALEDAKGRIRLFGALDTLKYLRKGGRIPKTTEMIGTMMGIKPLVQLTEGRLVMAGKARGHAGAVTGMVKRFEEDLNIDTAAPVYFGYTENDQYGRAFSKLVASKCKLKNTVLYPVGPIIGTHVGPNAFAFCYLSKGENNNT